MKSTTAEFFVVTEEEFPDGLVCIRCKRPIGSGQPYNAVFTGFTGYEETNIPNEELICVYC